MTRRLIFLPQVSEDLLRALGYYQDRGGGAVARNFENAFQNALEQVRAGTVTHARVFQQFRRVFVKGFLIICIIDSLEIQLS